ncbi:MAG: hypothetical protein DBX39_05210 [Bacillota bacterium]|nr:MAG: hypothetical protein DBX39_05210 [Bacillota bacterium]
MQKTGTDSRFFAVSDPRNSGAAECRAVFRRAHIAEDPSGQKTADARAIPRAKKREKCDKFG